MKKSTSGNSHTADMVDHYWGTINHVTGLIKSSEIKAGLILSFFGILLNLIYQSIGAWMDVLHCDLITVILIGLWSGCTAISIFYCIRCFIPRIEENYDDNIFFFEDVITKFGTIKEFAKTFYQISHNEEQLFEQMGEQIYISSKIAAWKFNNVKKAIRFLAIGLVLLLITVVYYVFLSVKN